mgnify:CR=1 FL=1
MEKIAIVNVRSFGREFPEFITELEEKVGPVKKFMFPIDVSGRVLAEELKGYTYVILGTFPTFGREFFENNHDVRLIARHGLGFNNIDLEAATRHHVYVTKEENAIERDAVAEQAAALLNAVAKNVVKADGMVHRNEWAVDRQRLMGFQMTGKTTGVIGFGNIGRRFGQIMKNGYGNRILAYDPFLPKEKAEEAGAELCDLDTLLRESDFISLHANLTDAGRHLLDESKFALMKPTAILINTARGQLIDEEALIRALTEKKIFGYGADVATQEPIQKENELLKLDNAVLTPHVAVYNRTCTENMNRKVMQDIYLVREGKKPAFIVNQLWEGC